MNFLKVPLHHLLVEAEVVENQAKMAVLVASHGLLVTLVAEAEGDVAPIMLVAEVLGMVAAEIEILQPIEVGPVLDRLGEAAMQKQNLTGQILHSNPRVVALVAAIVEEAASVCTCQML